jgi:methionyl aminopeptidase
MIFLKTREEVERIRECNIIIAEALKYIGKFVREGVSTWELDKEIESFIVKRNAQPSFKGLYGFPAATCISVQDEVVHGIPSKKRKLRAGEIVGIDVGVEMNGFYGDSAYTFAVGQINQEVEKLLKVTEESLYLGIAQSLANHKVGDIGHAIQKHVEQNNFSVVRELVGHGVGKKPHEDPQIPNFGLPDKGVVLKTGMVIAIEPMVNLGSHQVYFADDEWTVKTTDGSVSAHFEHSIALTDNGPDILSLIE